MTDQTTHKILVGMGADAPAREGDLMLLARELAARVAYLQIARPTLHDVLDEIAAEHSGGSVRLIPAPISGVPVPARSWLKRVAGHWVRANPGLLTIELADRPVTGREAGLTSPPWGEVPLYGRHVLICRGPRCTASGAAETAEAIADRLHERGLTDDEVLVTQTGCLNPCNHAPVIAVSPGEEWWGPVDAAGARALVDAWVDTPMSGPERPVRRPPR